MYIIVRKKLFIMIRVCTLFNTKTEPARGLLFDFGSTSPGSVLGPSTTTYCGLKLYSTTLRVSKDKRIRVE